MAANYNEYKYIGASKNYAHVYEVSVNGESRWTTRVNKKLGYRTNSKYYDTEKEAAISVDKALISIGKEPVNILKRVN